MGLLFLFDIFYASLNFRILSVERDSNSRGERTESSEPFGNIELFMM